MATSSRDLQENDIDVYVRLDSLENFVLYFNTVNYFFSEFKI